MKKIFNLISSILALSCLGSFISCSSEELSAVESGEHSASEIRLSFNVLKSGFEEEAITRAAGGTTPWKSGEKVFVQFANLSSPVSGVATYNGSSGEWSIDVDGTLSETESGTCVLTSFVDAEFMTGDFIRVNQHTDIYECVQGAYTYNGTELTVTGSLAPKLGRLHFAGTRNEIINVVGLTHYTSYDVKKNEWSTSNVSLKDTVKADGYTPYVYAYFSDQSCPRLNISLATTGFTRDCSNDMLFPGESGFLTIPNEANPKGWKNYLLFRVGNVDFKMIAVFDSPNLYYMGETEVTEGLYHAVIGGTTLQPDLPQTNVLYDEFGTFRHDLGAELGVNFTLPSSDEWQYAARGGAKSQNYTYAGSNDIDEVAWYKDNSENTLHSVKQKFPNELGLYDMSGNAAEWIAYRNTYYSYGYYYRGGNFSSTQDNCRYNSSDYKSTSSDYSDSKIGVRLKLTF